MNLTRRIDLVGYLHVGYGLVLLLIAAVMILLRTAGVLLVPGIAAWAADAGASLVAALILVAVALPSMIGGVGLIRRAAWARVLVIIVSLIDFFSFPFGTALGVFSLWILFKEEARREFR